MEYVANIANTPEREENPASFFGGVRSSAFPLNIV